MIEGARRDQEGGTRPSGELDRAASSEGKVVPWQEVFVAHAAGTAARPRRTQGVKAGPRRHAQGARRRGGRRSSRSTTRASR